MPFALQGRHVNAMSTQSSRCRAPCHHSLFSSLLDRFSNFLQCVAKKVAFTPNLSRHNGSDGLASRSCIGKNHKIGISWSEKWEYMTR